ncbi:hypothetical protein [Bacillus sp. UMB0728]|uniref:hypothetical protein n=1 Tax=Bacillus sp. UMB0728 TaxID=2066052 RepID=UPI000C76FC78|nr:hypothetical protein [Bacillus sp. UMB0728]PLR73161.1 hypothetical protein CYJ37_06295 [Bacillus sp. UMB0728]
MLKKFGLISIIVIFILAACSNIGSIESDCPPNAVIEWVDVLMVNGIKYEGGDEGLSEGEAPEKGKKIGEVTYTLADNACLGHKLKNGDAAFLPVGTEIYEIAGYRSDFRVLAGNQVYQVSENNKAKILSDLLDIKGKVAKMSLESDYDGSHISDFTEKETTEFIGDFLSLEYVGFNKVFKKIKGDRRVFLRIHLKDGSSFGIGYWLDENVLNVGAVGTERMKGIVKGRKEE